MRHGDGVRLTFGVAWRYHRSTVREMRSHRVALIAAGLTSGWFAAAQDGEAPAIAQGGIVNLASRIPVQQPVGGAAPGSLISIRGFRFGAGPPDTVRVRIRWGETLVETPPLSVSEHGILAIVPDNAPLGSAMLQVIRNTHASRELPIEIVESSFGAFSRNREGWGPGAISNADGLLNSESHAAKPGEAVTISGTGLGVQTRGGGVPKVLVAGHLATEVQVLNRTADLPGVDTISFHLPLDAPQGCHVPIQVNTAPGHYSNGVMMAISTSSSVCSDPFDWTAGFRNRKLTLATVGLVHADVELGTKGKTSVYPIDAGFATFNQIEQSTPVQFLFLFPPLGACNTYLGTANLQTLTQSLELLEIMPGRLLDAGASVSLIGPGRAAQQLLPSESEAGRYWQLLGGHVPVNGIEALPLFLKPGQYQISAPGGTDVGAFHTGIRAEPPLVWKNRSQLYEVNRQEGVSVTWLDKNPSKLIVILALNQDPGTGALALCACLAKASAGTFHIPPSALMNVPPSVEGASGLPLHLVILLELPEMPVTAGSGTEGTLAFAASLAARTVQFK